MPNGLQSSSSSWWCRGSRVAWFLGKRRADGGDIMATPHGVDRQGEELFQTVRGVNASLPPARRIRVLLGDPPIEWETVNTPEDHRKWIEMRDTYPADLIQREVLSKGRKALLTYGQMHFQRKNVAANYESEGPAETIVSRLENKWGAQVFTIFTADVA